MKNYDHIIKYIKYLADSANSIVVTFNEISSGLTGKCSEMPNVSYARPMFDLDILRYAAINT